MELPLLLDKLVVHSTKPKSCTKIHNNAGRKKFGQNSFPLINHHKQATETRDYTIFTQWMKSFYFALLRISIAQILKANGFDKCKPSTLNVMTDLYSCKPFKMPLGITKCSNMRTNSNSPELQDITQALINISIFKANEVTKIHDEYYEESRYNTKSIEAFYQWCKK